MKLKSLFAVILLVTLLCTVSPVLLRKHKEVGRQPLVIRHLQRLRFQVEGKRMGREI